MREREREPKAFFTPKQNFISIKRTVTQILHLDIYPKELETGTKTDTCMLVFTAALFIIAKMQKQYKSPSTDEWIHKMWYVYTMEYFSAIKRNEVLIYVTIWINLKNFK